MDSGMDFLSTLLYYVASFLAVVIVLTLHEFSHAAVAYACGDPTAKWSGRMTLNPLKHFDLLGLICFTLVGFGWAKPVPINQNNFRRPRLGLFLTSAAGVAMNLVTAALLFYPLYLVVISYLPYSAGAEFLSEFLLLLYLYSLSFAVFNLLPLHPLDGFRIVDAFNRRRGPVFRFLRDYGHYILLGLVVWSFACDLLGGYIAFFGYLDILGWVMTFARDIVGAPIQFLWGLIPW